MIFLIVIYNYPKEMTMVLKVIIPWEHSLGAAA